MPRFYALFLDCSMFHAWSFKVHPFLTLWCFQLVRRCLDSVHLSGITNGYGLLPLALRWTFTSKERKNLLDWLAFCIQFNLIFWFHHLNPVIIIIVSVRYFIGTNATSTFRSIVSSYPGQLILVSIQVYTFIKYLNSDSCI